jgi:hypothetical protein
VSSSLFLGTNLNARSDAAVDQQQNADGIEQPVRRRKERLLVNELRFPALSVTRDRAMGAGRAMAIVAFRHQPGAPSYRLDPPSDSRVVGRDRSSAFQLSMKAALGSLTFKATAADSYSSTASCEGPVALTAGVKLPQRSDAGVPWKRAASAQHLGDCAFLARWDEA